MRDGSTSGLFSALARSLNSLLQRRAHEVVGVVHDERDAGMVFLVDAPRVFRRNDDGAVELAVAHVLHGLLVAVVRHGRRRCARSTATAASARGPSPPGCRRPDRPRRACASLILPPKALPSTINCTSGNTIATSISAGERKNLRSSRSTMAHMRFMGASPDGRA